MVGDVLELLDALYPPLAAEAWDVVGLAIGSRVQPVTRIAYAVDCTIDVLAEARQAGADLLITHHPPLLRGLTAVDLEHPKGRLVAEALASGVSVLVAHTNADVPRGGVVDALADVVGLGERRPLRPRSASATDGTGTRDKIVTFVPAEHAPAVIDALAAAGAGRIGRYERCAFTSTGEGTFRPRHGATPSVGDIGRTEHVAEIRVEMVLDRSRRRAVRDALLAAHPYEEPAYDVLELVELPSDQRGDGAGLGRVGELTRPTTVAGLARHLAAALPTTARGVSFAGDPGRPVTRVAVQAGAGDDLIDDARAAGAEVYITSDLRHHPAAEALAWPDAPGLIDISHWAAEWTWLPVVQRLLDEALGARSVPTMVSRLCTDPWTASYPVSSRNGGGG